MFVELQIESKCFKSNLTHESQFSNPESDLLITGCMSLTCFAPVLCVVGGLTDLNTTGTHREAHGSAVINKTIFYTRRSVDVGRHYTVRPPTYVGILSRMNLMGIWIDRLREVDTVM